MFSRLRYSHEPQCDMNKLASRTDKSVNVCNITSNFTQSHHWQMK